jgi:hypothetical protein
MNRAIASTAAALGAAAFAGAASGAASGQPGFHCGAAHFSADIRQGPDTDLSLSGKLKLDVASSGRVSGDLVHYGKSLPVSGKVNGRAFKLTLHLRSGRSMTGVGTASKPIASCLDVPTKGTATGPRAGDKGVWGYALGGRSGGTPG